MAGFRLARLPRNIPLVDKAGQALQTLQQWWQSVVTKIEENEDTQNQLISDLQVTQGELQATQIELQQAQDELAATQAELAAAQGELSSAQADIIATQTDVSGLEASKQNADATLTALAALSVTAGLLEQTGPDTFTKRALGVGAGTSIPTRADADGRYVVKDAQAAPAYSGYTGQTVSPAYAQGEAQATDNAVTALASAVSTLIARLQAADVLT